MVREDETYIPRECRGYAVVDLINEVRDDIMPFTVVRIGYRWPDSGSVKMS